MNKHYLLTLIFLFVFSIFYFSSVTYGKEIRITCSTSDSRVTKERNLGIDDKNKRIRHIDQDFFLDVLRYDDDVIQGFYIFEINKKVVYSINRNTGTMEIKVTCIESKIEDQSVECKNTRHIFFRVRLVPSNQEDCPAKNTPCRCRYRRQSSKVAAEVVVVVVAGEVEEETAGVAGGV